MMRQTRVAGMSDEERLRTADMADFAKMEEIRARVDSIVTDRGTAKALKPWYGYFCKRPCFHDEYTPSTGTTSPSSTHRVAVSRRYRRPVSW